jgi:hypothetical protein
MPANIYKKVGLHTLSGSFDTPYSKAKELRPIEVKRLNVL